MNRQIMITVAPVARAANPDDEVINPLKPEEIAEEVFESAKAGASQVHLHVRSEKRRNNPPDGCLLAHPGYSGSNLSRCVIATTLLWSS